MESAFELKRMFIGDLPLLFMLEVAVRTLIMYLYTIGLVRLLGKRGMQPLAPFELVIIIALGSAVGDPMFYPDVPLVHAMIVVTIIVAMERLFAMAAERSNLVEHVLESRPTLVVSGGQLLEHNLRHESIARDELFSALRLAGIENLGQVRLAYMEPSGQVSVFRAEEPQDGLLILPERYG